MRHFTAVLLLTIAAGSANAGTLMASDTPATPQPAAAHHAATTAPAKPAARPATATAAASNPQPELPVNSLGIYTLILVGLGLMTLTGERTPEIFHA